MQGIVPHLSLRALRQTVFCSCPQAYDLSLVAVGNNINAVAESAIAFMLPLRTGRCTRSHTVDALTLGDYIGPTNELLRS